MGENKFDVPYNQNGASENYNISAEEVSSRGAVSQKTDGLQPGTRVAIPAGDPDLPFKGIVDRCYELGPVPQEQYAVIIRLDDEIMEMEGVRKIYPQGLMLCMNDEIQVISEPDGTYLTDNQEHFFERCLSLGWTFTGALTCNTGQMLYVFEPMSRQPEMSQVVREDGRSAMLYNSRGTAYSLLVTKWLIYGF